MYFLKIPKNQLKNIYIYVLFKNSKKKSRELFLQNP